MPEEVPEVGFATAAEWTAFAAWTGLGLIFWLARPRVCR